MKTKQEVIDFLESKVGTTVPCKGNPSLDGQCVTLIKALMEFLGVPNPYKARGHAKTCISTYLNEGIADKGVGFISVFSNKFMGGGYGHIWCNVGDGKGEYYEQNGAIPLKVSKGEVYSYDNVCNFDKYITENGGSGEATESEDKMLLEYLGANNEQEAKKRLAEHLGERDGKCDWGNSDDDRGGFLGGSRRRVVDLENEADRLRMDVKHLEEKIEDHECETNLLIEESLKIGGKTLILNGMTIDSDGKAIGNYEVQE